MTEASLGGRRQSTAIAEATGGPPAGRPQPRRRPLARFVGFRLVMLPISVFLIITVSFFIFALLPGDIPHAILGPLATPGQIAAINTRFGLDHSIFVRYGDFISALFHGSLGVSYYTGNAVTHEIGTRLPATIELVVPALLLAFVLGVTIGSIGAYYSHRGGDRIAGGTLTVIQSIPDFLLGLLLIVIFFSTLHLLPGPEGQLSFADVPPPHVTGMYVIDAMIAGQWSLAGSALRHLILPALTLGIVYSAAFGRTTRALLGQALSSEYSRFGRACGLSERRLLWNGLLAVRTSLMTYGAVLLAAIIGGDAVVEIVFAWNGVGQWAVQSMLRQDLPSVEGFVVIVGTLTVVTYLLLDLASALLDPRIRFDVRRGR